jgi:hypothetical protein
MTVVTLYFCGTACESRMFASNDECRHGYIVAVLAQNNAGQAYRDWLIADGPGSGNLQQDEFWVEHPMYSHARGNAQGSGWEENTYHAIAFLKGENTWERDKHTAEEVRTLHKHGVNIGSVKTKRGWTLRTYEEVIARKRISPQSIQARGAQISRKNNPVTMVNLIGHSRGGVTCFMLANAMWNDPALKGIPVNIFSIDPVPGFSQFHEHRTKIHSNVKHYVGVYARDERSRGFSALAPRYFAANGSIYLPYSTAAPPSSIKYEMVLMPGKHGTVAGNTTNTGGSSANDRDHAIFSPGKIVRDMAEKYLIRWGTKLNNTLNLTDPEILAAYQKMISNSQTFNAMHNISYVYFTQAQREVGFDSTYSSNIKTYSQIPCLNCPPNYINNHHKAVSERMGASGGGRGGYRE